MKRFLRKFRYGEKGFTLIELLIVIAVLGVLAAVVIPNVQRFTQSGQKAAAQQEMGTVQTAVDAGMAEAGATSVPALGFLISAGSENDAGGGVIIEDFLRRTIEGQWTVTGDGDGMIASGVFKYETPAVDHWAYDGTTDEWSWVEVP